MFSLFSCSGIAFRSLVYVLTFVIIFGNFMAGQVTLGRRIVEALLDVVFVPSFAREVVDLMEYSLFPCFL